MKLLPVSAIGLALATLLQPSTAKQHRDFFLDLYEDDQCESQTKRINISEDWRIWQKNSPSKTDIWETCVDFSDPFNSVRFEVTGEYPTRSSKNCRVDVFKGPDCQGPKLASWAIGFCQDEDAGDADRCHSTQDKIDPDDGWSMRGICSYVDAADPSTYFLMDEAGPDYCKLPKDVMARADPDY